MNASILVLLFIFAFGLERALSHTHDVYDEQALFPGAKSRILQSTKDLYEQFTKTAAYTEVKEKNDFDLHHEKVTAFCQARPKLCSWEEYYFMIEKLHEPFSKLYDPVQLPVPLGSLLSYIPKDGAKVRYCKKIKKPSMEHFFREYVVKSQPVIITGAMDDWPALKKWSTAYLLQKAGNQQIAVSVTPDGEFDKTENATLWFPDDPAYVLSSAMLNFTCPPAHIAVTFMQFLSLIHSDFAKEASYYLEYFPVSAFDKEVDDDIGKVPFSDFLFSRFKLFWIGGHTNGKLHFDRYDNLMAQVKGQKTFTLFDPSQSQYLHGGEHFDTATLDYGWDKGGKAHFLRDKSRVAKMGEDAGTVNTMSPVDIQKPDLKHWPKYAQAVPTICTIKEGEILFNPAHWWHEVQSQPNEEKISIGVNYFFEPFYQRYNSLLPFFTQNRFYQNLRPPESVELGQRKATLYKKVANHKDL